MCVAVQHQPPSEGNADVLGSLRPHVHLRLLRERQGCFAKAENGEK